MRHARRSRLVASLAVGAASLLSSAPAFAAPDVQECIAAFDRGQRARTDRALKKAQTELLVCTQESCPSLLRADCGGVLKEVRAALPTVVFAADDEDGNDVLDAKVYVGSDRVVEKLDGKAIELDPGKYEFRYERGGKTIVVTLAILEGEKNRIVRATFPSSKPVVPPPPQPLPVPERSTFGHVVPGALAAIGVVGLGFAGWSRLRFDSRVEEMRSSCAPDCSASDRDALSSTLVQSNVSLAIGGGALALAALAWFVFAPPSASRTTGASARMGPHVFVGTREAGPR
jgi:hypothetical protein